MAIPVAGHLHEKNGFYYVILNLRDEQGKRKPKWIPTGLTIKGNKKKAEQMLMDARKEYADRPIVKMQDEMLFADYMISWLNIVKPTVRLTTFASYDNMVRSSIAPHFRKTGITLRALQPKDIQDFYSEKLKTVKPNSVIHYHANIHKALKTAVKLDMIPVNPADRVERPKKTPLWLLFTIRMKSIGCLSWQRERGLSLAL